MLTCVLVCDTHTHMCRQTTTTRVATTTTSRLRLPDANALNLALAGSVFMGRRSGIRLGKWLKEQGERGKEGSGRGVEGNEGMLAVGGFHGVVLPLFGVDWPPLVMGQQALQH